MPHSGAGGAVTLDCQEHEAVGTHRACWIGGLWDEGFAQNFCLDADAFFFSLPADSLCKPVVTKRKSGSMLTTHHLIPDFLSVPQIFNKLLHTERVYNFLKMSLETTISVFSKLL